MAGKPPKPHEFKFPAALSPSLRSVFIMGGVVQVTSQSEAIVHEILHPKCPFCPSYQRLLDDVAIPKYLTEIQAEDAMNNTASHDIPHEACHEWIKATFSPCELLCPIYQLVRLINWHYFFPQYVNIDKLIN